MEHSAQFLFGRRSLDPRRDYTLSGLYPLVIFPGASFDLLQVKIFHPGGGVRREIEREKEINTHSDLLLRILRLVIKTSMIVF